MYFPPPPSPFYTHNWMNEDLLFNRTLLHQIFFILLPNTDRSLPGLIWANWGYQINSIIWTELLSSRIFQTSSVLLFRSLCRDSGRFYCLYVCVTFCAANRPSGFFSLPAEARKTQALNQQAWPLLSSLSSGLLWTPLRQNPLLIYSQI
jgi:hypothetical protein